MKLMCNLCVFAPCKLVIITFAKKGSCFKHVLIPNIIWTLMDLKLWKAQLSQRLPWDKSTYSADIRLFLVYYASRLSGKYTGKPDPRASTTVLVST